MGAALYISRAQITCCGPDTNVSLIKSSTHQPSARHRRLAVI